MSDYVLVLTTVEDEEQSNRLATTLVEERLAACVNAIGPIRSVYRWQGAVERAEERQLVIKTRADCAEAVLARIKALHPYELPELLVIQILKGSAEYLQWIDEATR